MTQWTPLEADYVRINCDGSWDPTTCSAGVGIICRDSEGQVKFIKASRKEGVKDIVAAESRASFMSMKESVKQNFQKAIFTFDNLELIQFLRRGQAKSISNPKWIMECKRLINHYDHWRLELILREGNVMVDFLAQRALLQGWEWHTSDAIPICISLVVKKRSHCI
ncbi:hypothetical protein QQ045_030127 [Rhodiola kirilowii]